MQADHSASGEPSHSIQPIQTEYSGVTFRSRLEARWALYFDLVGIKWQYEKEGYQLDSGWYVPDFWLPDLEIWAEVKPSALTIEESAKAMDLTIVTRNPSVCLIGPPSPIAYPINESFSATLTAGQRCVVAYQPRTGVAIYPVRDEKQKLILPPGGFDLMQVLNVRLVGERVLSEVRAASDLAVKHRFDWRGAHA